MGPKWFRVTITDHDYYYTTYRTAVEATSKVQAIALGAATIGQEKYKRAIEGKDPRFSPMYSFLVAPEVKVEECPLEEYWENRDKVVVVD